MTPKLPPPANSWITAGGLRLEAAWWGPGPEAAPSIVLLHEGLGAVALWRDFPAALAARTGCGVLAFSRAGYGHSDHLPAPFAADYMHREAAEQLRPVLDAAGIRRCLLLGHSDGGSIAALYAGTEPDERLRGLILLAPHFLVEAVTLAGIRDARTQFAAGDLRRRLARYHADADATFWNWNDAWLSPEFRAWNITEAASGIGVPVLVLQGLADPYGTAAQVQALQAATDAPVRAVLLPDVGHAPHLQATEATLAAIVPFVAERFAAL
jgi:pimeloyl-ACP methyl ester carboxylesterase